MEFKYPQMNNTSTFGQCYSLRGVILPRAKQLHSTTSYHLSTFGALPASVARFPRYCAQAALSLRVTHAIDIRCSMFVTITPPWWTLTSQRLRPPSHMQVSLTMGYGWAARHDNRAELRRMVYDTKICIKGDMNPGPALQHEEQ